MLRLAFNSDQDLTAIETKVLHIPEVHKSPKALSTPLSTLSLRSPLSLFSLLSLNFGDFQAFHAS